MKRLHAPFVALLAVVCLLAGCGQKGPLYLPDDEKAAKEHQKDVYIR
ncbi:lipoprotein [Pseudomonas boanensis]